MESENLTAGLYDANDNLIASWSTLVNTYEINVENDYGFSHDQIDIKSPSYILTHEGDLINGVKLIVDDSVTGIGEYAFYQCTNLTSVTIGSGVTNIDDAAFQSCSSLTNIIITDSITSIGIRAFDGCTSLTSITIPDSVTSIGHYAFRRCTNMSSVTIGNGVTLINDYTFYNCSSLTSIVIPDSVTSVGNYSFDGCSSLGSVTIGNGVTNIGSYAFHNCSSIAAVVIPDSVTNISNSAFYGCSSLTSVTIGNNVEYIGSSAFYNCSNLTSINIPNSLQRIDGAFYNVNSANLSYNIYDNGKYLGTDDNPYYILIGYTSNDIISCNIHEDTKVIDGYAFYYCKNLASIVIPYGVISIGAHTFRNCTSLTNVILPSSVMYIGGGAFTGCNNLYYEIYNNAKYLGNASNWYHALVGLVSNNMKVYTIRKGTKIIGASAFNGSALMSIAIPNSVININRSAFGSCNYFYNVYYDGTEEEWNAITIDPDVNDRLLTATVNYFIPDAEINYGNETIATVKKGDAAVIDCMNKMMTKDITINVFGNVSENTGSGSETTTWDGTDLTGTTWRLNNVIGVMLPPGSFNLVGVAYDGTHTVADDYLIVLTDGGGDEPIKLCLFKDSLGGRDLDSAFWYSSNSGWTYNYNEYNEETGWYTQVSEQTTNVHLSISGGIDTTTSFVIEWFKQNATLISVGGSAPILQHKTITGNGTYMADEGFVGLMAVTVNVPGEIVEVWDGSFEVV